MQGMLALCQNAFQVNVLDVSLPARRDSLPPSRIAPFFALSLSHTHSLSLSLFSEVLILLIEAFRCTVSPPVHSHTDRYHSMLPVSNRSTILLWDAVLGRDLIA